MDQAAMDLERLKMQRTAMYLQIVSVVLSGIFVYALISGKNKVRTVSNPDDFDEDDFDNMLD